MGGIDAPGITTCSTQDCINSAAAPRSGGAAGAIAFTFERGERIWTEGSHTYNAGEFETLLGRAGFIPITR
jgi:hypothetical protein